MNYLIYSLMFLIVVSCDIQIRDEINPILDPVEYQKALETANAMLNKSEDDQIDDYIRRYGWKMKHTGTGLRYMIYIEGHGEQVQRNSLVRFHCVLQLVNGFVAYNSHEEGVMEVLINKADIPVGLNEGLQKLKEGDKAKLIVPSHLGYGLLGYGNTIPSKAILIYHIEIIEVINPFF